MIVASSLEIAGTAHDVSGSGWESRRLIVREHGMGHSVHETRVKDGAELHLHYKNHFETNYCLSGEGEVVHKDTGEVFPIRPGTVYALNNHDPHILRAKNGDLVLICVFTPPLAGNEVHREDGSYAASE